ncbi:MAG: hypothetical protein U1F41_01050 [Burkholderiales bacterium]
MSQTSVAADSPLLPVVRERVRAHLMSSPAFMALSDDKRREVAHNTVNALHYILGGEDGRTVPQSMTLGGNSAGFAPSEALAGIAATTVNKAATVAPGAMQQRNAPQDGIGQAARAGGRAFTDTIADVNFPAFVGGLIDGVFNSIVTTSIKQMEAYAEMVKNVSKSVDQYMKDNVTENHARDYLADRYPGHLQVDISGDAPRLKPKEGLDDSNLPDFFNDLGLKAPVTSLDEDNVESELVPAARRRIAMDRQQMLATMVMMGVNRLVVTNGSIEASCMFELDTTDTHSRDRTRTTDFDSSRERTTDWGADERYNQKWDGSRNFKVGNDNVSFEQKNNWSGDYTSGWYSKGTGKDTAKFNMKTVDTRNDNETINLHAQLAGKVKVNFKSDYFPMEKMIDVFQIQKIQEKTPAGQTQPAAAPPPPPPLPAMPSVPAPATPAPAPPAPAPAARA